MAPTSTRPTPQSPAPFAVFTHATAERQLITGGRTSASSLRKTSARRLSTADGGQSSLSLLQPWTRTARSQPGEDQEDEDSARPRTAQGSSRINKLQARTQMPHRKQRQRRRHQRRQQRRAATLGTLWSAKVLSKKQPPLHQLGHHLVQPWTPPLKHTPRPLRRRQRTCPYLRRRQQCSFQP